MVFVEVTATFLAGRALSLIESRALRLPSSEKALLLFCFGAFVSLLGSLSCSHGKPGGDDGGLDTCAGASEKTAGGELAGASLSGAKEGSRPMVVAQQHSPHNAEV